MRLERSMEESEEVNGKSLKGIYEGISQELLEAKSLTQLGAIEHPELMKTAEHLKKEKRAAYQENLLDQLLGDMLGPE